MQIKARGKELSDMAETKLQVNSSTLVSLMVEGMQNKKGIDIKVLDLRHVGNAVVDYFVVCSGNTDTQVRALMENVEFEIEEKTDELPWMKEGMSNGEWIILDYVDVVAHIFKRDKRNYFGIEELWGDAKVTTC